MRLRGRLARRSGPSAPSQRDAPRAAAGLWSLRGYECCGDWRVIIFRGLVEFVNQLRASRKGEFVPGTRDLREGTPRQTRGRTGHRPRHLHGKIERAVLPSRFQPNRPEQSRATLFLESLIKTMSPAPGRRPPITLTYSLTYCFEVTYFFARSERIY